MEYKTSIKGLISFEFKSFIWRKLINPSPKYSKNINYLNLGCGPNYIEGYLNADFFPRLNPFKKGIKADWYLDLRFPINCKEEFFEGIFTEHTLEHLYPSDVKNLLNELYRVLKKDGTIRITVPSLESYVKFYNQELSEPHLSEMNKRFVSGCTAIRNLTQNFHHLSVWDFEELRRYLLEAGFKNIERKEFGSSTNPKLVLDQKSREYETLYIEAKK